MRITFDEQCREFVLDSFGKCVNKDGYIAEKANPTQRVLTNRGEEIRSGEFVGVRKGSIVMIKSDIVSLVEAAVAIG